MLKGNAPKYKQYKVKLILKYLTLIRTLSTTFQTQNSILNLRKTTSWYFFVAASWCAFAYMHHISKKSYSLSHIFLFLCLAFWVRYIFYVLKARMITWSSSEAVCEIISKTYFKLSRQVSTLMIKAIRWTNRPLIQRGFYLKVKMSVKV